eukprot:Gregarina_sp_Pseudo_9__1131@NODE_173_length_3833_cov_46_265683_g159_i0_p2_GENE_NODE_173_length_3833_cov_46_265683_g159_i0NODE_173_length_3833_cov_46_265683_g159_i0_p2_ORF_typecomplete_len294_score48_93PcfJ/PF14284_6/0_32PcfJ/PF14284_6/1_4e03_NODE_173_length_3833_cov_46_265683_g159_i02371118
MRPALCLLSLFALIKAEVHNERPRFELYDRKDRRLNRRNEQKEMRGRDVAHMPSPPELEVADKDTEVVLLRSARDLVQQLNMTLAPPENKVLAPLPRGSGSLLRSDMVKEGNPDPEVASSWADESADFAKQVVSNLVPGLTGDVPGSLIRKVTQGVEKRKARTLEQQGIQYDSKTAIYRNPLGLPCDPRTHPLLCTLDEEFTTSTSTKPSLLQQHRQQKKRSRAPNEGKRDARAESERVQPLRGRPFARRDAAEPRGAGRPSGGDFAPGTGSAPRRVRRGSGRKEEKKEQVDS